MNLPTPSSPGIVVVDANIFIAICSREPSEATARAALSDYTERNWGFYAPSVILAEFLFVLCRKLQAGIIDAETYKKALEDFNGSYLPAILPPPTGDASLLLRAEEIRSGYGCSRSTDGFYIALAEAFVKSGTAELLTFDEGMVNQVAKNAPGVKVNLLPT
jgi:predicted nucleic acid-binding protein